MQDKFKTKNKSIAQPLLVIVFLLLMLVPDFSQATLVGTTNNATLKFSPESGVYKAQEIFPIDILVNTAGQAVNVVDVYVHYNPSLFEVVNIDTSGSVFTNETDNIINAVSGLVIINRGLPTPGINTTSGKVATLNIKGLANTTPSVDNFTFGFTAGSEIESDVVKNSDNTNILTGVYNGRFSIDGTAPANVSSFTATAVSATSIALSWTNPSTDFNGVKILRKTTGFSTSPSDGTVVYDSNGTSYNDIGLVSGQTYYYTAFSRDIVLNYSSGATASVAPADAIKPAQISSLAATALTARSVRLNWTATGDDGNSGTATSYDIRYATALITAANWSTATQVTGEPMPAVNGVAETMTIAGLTGATNYYFAIRATDESNNISDLSNVVLAQTYRTADLNNNRSVNSIDFSILLSNWKSTSRPAADINQNGIVDSIDFSIMMSQWASSY